MERVGGNGPTSAGWFLTAPDSAETPFRLAYSGDINSNPAYHVLFDDLIASTADAFLSLGDWPYADVGSVATTIEQYRKAPGASLWITKSSTIGMGGIRKHSPNGSKQV